MILVLKLDNFKYKYAELWKILLILGSQLIKSTTNNMTGPTETI